MHIQDATYLRVMLDDVSHCNVSRASFPTYIPDGLPCDFPLQPLVKGGNRRKLLVEEPWGIVSSISMPPTDSKLYNKYAHTPLYIYLSLRTISPTGTHFAHAHSPTPKPKPKPNPNQTKPTSGHLAGRDRERGHHCAGGRLPVAGGTQVHL